MGTPNTIRPMGTRDLDRIITVAVVIGQGAAAAFKSNGVCGLYQGTVDSPCKWRIKVLDFLSEETLEQYCEGVKNKYRISAPSIDVLILRGEDVTLYEGLVAKSLRVRANYVLTKNGNIRPKQVRPLFRNAEAVFNDNSVNEYAYSSIKLTALYHDVTDIIYGVVGKEGVYVHEIKGEAARYYLDFNLLRYWKFGGVEPEPERTVPAYCEVRDISFGARAFLKVEQEARAEILLDCSVRWTDYRLVAEVGRKFVVDSGRITTMYNYFSLPSRMISPFWFNGVDTSGKSRLMDNRAYIKTLRGRQWYHIHYCGKVEKERFEPDGI